MSYHLAGCCSPLKGDSIVGIVTAGIGVAVHTLDCDTLSSYQELVRKTMAKVISKDADLKSLLIEIIEKQDQ